MTQEEETSDLEAQPVVPVVSLIVTNTSGIPVYLNSVGGAGLTDVLRTAAELTDYPVDRIDPIDSIGQEIYDITDSSYIPRISGTFCHLKYKDIESLLDILKSGDLAYTLVVSY